MRNRKQLSNIVAIIVFFVTFLFVVPQPSNAAVITARSLALKLVVSKENSTGYVRSAFKLWTDDDHDGCDTRKEVLIAESKVPVTRKSNCKITLGRWYSWYDGKTWTNPSDVSIDHVVPLKEAWESGAKSWTSANRERYANDFDFSWSLDAVTNQVNSSKGDKDPTLWLPSLASARCTYAIHWVAVKYRWQLSVDTAERKKLLSILSGICGTKKITVPQVIDTSASANQNVNINTNTSNTNQSSLVIKKSTTGICHAPGTTYYDRTLNFTPFDTLQACLDSGGRLPLK